MHFYPFWFKYLSSLPKDDAYYESNDTFGLA